MNLVKALLFLMLLGALTSCTNAQFGKLWDVNVGYNKGYSPDQPVKFEHSQHAGDYKIPCQYCHTQARRARTAGAPSLNICWNCHMSIRQVNGKRSEEIQKVVKAYEDKMPIQWVRVHMLPDHARFNHAPHVQNGVACQKCHGPVEKMKKVVQHTSMSMGWCVNCHRENDTGKKGPLNCTTCHY